jgi:hypothetical protein
MTTPASPYQRRYRTCFIIGLPMLFLACMGTIAYVSISTGSGLATTPLLFLGVGILRLMRWVIIWLSTPQEQKLFARSMDREPLLGLIRGFIKRERLAAPTR